MNAKAKNIISQLLSLHLAIAVYSVTIELDLQHRNVVGVGEYKLGMGAFPERSPRASEFIPSLPDFRKKSTPQENLNRNKLPDRRSVRI